MPGASQAESLIGKEFALEEMTTPEDWGMKLHAVREELTELDRVLTDAWAEITQIEASGQVESQADRLEALEDQIVAAARRMPDEVRLERELVQRLADAFVEGKITMQRLKEFLGGPLKRTG